ncbi:MAG: hypothetical protein D6B25_10145 [Desulfobulbaceae bacterium]|nr:MAG: hypothetical protein D6B25_10145 [Desulfobulbaceae bacterium]
MDIVKFIDEQPLILTEGAISERLRRLPGIALHPVLFNAPIIYNQTGRALLESIYLSYRQVAKKAGLPIILCAPTWRVDGARVEASNVVSSINRDAVAFMLSLKQSHRHPDSEIIAGALLAPKNDCYTPSAALNREQSAEFHQWQIHELCEAGVDLIISQTMPGVSESLGMADRLGPTSTPYIISFVINRFGAVLDSTPLFDAIERIDQSVQTPPLGYMVNCVYPSFVKTDGVNERLLSRLIGIQANASSKDHDQLDGSEKLQRDPLNDWCRDMFELHRNSNVKILGGCCGTDDVYLEKLVDLIPR